MYVARGFFFGLVVYNSSMRKIAIIDGKSVFYRGYYAMGHLSLPDGTPTGAVYGFISILLAVVEQLKPDNVYVAWDIKGTSMSKRTEIYPEYKAGRVKPPEDFYAQIPILQDILREFGIPFLETDNYEADDIIATLAKQVAERSDCQAYLISSDLDMLQLLAPNVEMWALKTGLTKVEEYTPAKFEAKYGLKVEQFLDLKSLQGDSSDNIPGVAGVGPKTATDLLQKYGTLEKIYENLAEIMEEKPAVGRKLEAGKEMAFLSKKLAQLYYDAPVKLDLSQGELAKADVADIMAALDKLAFRSLKNRFAKLFAAPAPEASNQLGLFGSEATMAELPTKSTAEVVQKEDLKSLNQALKDQKAILEVISNMVYLQPIGQEKVWAVEPQLWSGVDLKVAQQVISYDIKQTLYRLDKIQSMQRLADLPFSLEQTYDLNQAEFLLDPLTPRQVLESVNEVDLPRLVAMYQHQQARFAELPRLAKVANEIDFPLIPVLFLIEKRGVKIDLPTFERLSKELGEAEQKLSAEIYELAGKTFNINSPAQLSEVLFTDLKLPTVGIKKTKTAFSTGKKELDKLYDKHPIIAKIMQLREVAKIKSTYVDALPKLVDTNSRLHTTFTQDVTATGRLSSLNPNLQNIPTRTELGQLVRQGFVAEEGKVLISADYAQFELRLAAVLSDDQDMLAVFNAGRDIHQDTAADIYQVEPEAVTKEQRRVAKVVNFSVLYGAGPRNLTQTVAGMSYAEAKQLIERYFAARHKVRAFMDQTLAQAEKDGFVETYFGRRRPTPDIKSSSFVVREAAKRASINMPIQGTGADLMKMAMVKIERVLSKFKTAQQILQIHDSILIECGESEADEVAKVVEEIMESVCPELKIDLAVDTNIGQNWSEL